MRLIWRAIALAGMALLAGCEGLPQTSPSPASLTNVLPPSGPNPTETHPPAMLVAAGDIGWDGAGSGAAETGAMLDALDGTIALLGDIAYRRGTLAEFLKNLDPFWGKHKARMRPVPGNHEYDTPGATGYFEYFGERAGFDRSGFYTYELAGWQIYALNSNIAADAGSVQYRWLAAELAANPSACALAYWHHPVVSSGKNGNNTAMQPIWQLLAEHHADVVLVGHDHLYERFAPQDGLFRFAPHGGMRQFTVGTGGAPIYPVGTPQRNSEVRLHTWGVLQLTLHDGDYEWQFVTPEGTGDSGSAVCF